MTKGIGGACRFRPTLMMWNGVGTTFSSDWGSEGFAPESRRGDLSGSGGTRVNEARSLGIPADERTQTHDVVRLRGRLVSAPKPTSGAGKRAPSPLKTLQWEGMRSGA